ncbi:MAG TPA: hypothetical protein VK401_09360 [Propionibacteriaceae bacterium]|nr:hypothetical protein [Propionibacteriaceae bacterium]
MSVVTRSGRTGRRSGSARGVRARALAGFLAVLGLVLVVGACGTDAQTLKPYTPAEGVNFDVGDSYDPERVVHVRNLLIISKQPGSGILSASLVTDGRDQLTGISGFAIKPDGSQGAPLRVTLTNTVSIANRAQIVLTDQTPISVTSADLAPGLTASMTLTFANAGEHTVIVPVVDGNEPEYQSISPAPTPST